MTLRAWIEASRLPSQSYIALPLLLGQLLAFRATAEWSWAVFALVHAFGLFDQLYIVYANDYADRDTDRLNETSTIFSGGSRVLVDGKLSATSLARAAVVAAVLALGVGVVLLVGWGRVWSVPLMAVGIALLWAYSYRPIRLSYRGGGELLQMLGVGLILPLVGFEAQAGELASFPWSVLAFLLPLNLATALCTALPDEPSDRASTKRSAAVLLGGATARAVTIGLNLLGLVAFGWLTYPAIEAFDAGRATLLALPVTAVIAQIAVSRIAQPGSRGIIAFVFFGLLCNLSLVAASIIDLAVT